MVLGEEGQPCEIPEQVIMKMHILLISLNGTGGRWFAVREPLEYVAGRFRTGTVRFLYGQTI